MFLLTEDVHSVREINWSYIGDAVPAFLTILIIPLSYKYVCLIPCSVPSDVILSQNCMQHRLRCHRRHRLLDPLELVRLDRSLPHQQPDLAAQLRREGALGHPAWGYRPSLGVSPLSLYTHSR